VIGALRDQIIIQSEVQATDGQGGYSLTWGTLATVWADIQPASGREIFQAQMLRGVVTHKITMRNPVGRDDEEPRQLKGTRAFNIRAVDQRGRAGSG
jgi:SPP1 family predicted phage head-tail adaptor